MRKSLLLFLVASAAGLHSFAFALLGPFENWQSSDLGYQQFGADIGGPRNLGEEYRWNVPEIVYGFDRAFIDYFGEQGVAAVQSAFAILNNLPAASEMELDSFPRETRRVHLEAEAANLIDLKSTALSLVVEQLGLTTPERFVWTLRSRSFIGGSTNAYVVISRNFDPESLLPSALVNQSRYTYQIIEFGGADAREIPADPESALHAYTSVLSFTDPVIGVFNPGLYITGLTRDDAGGLRYLIEAGNVNLEFLHFGAVGANPNEAPVSQALRPGVEKLTFQYEPDWESQPNWSRQIEWEDRYFLDGVLLTQAVTRTIVRPDIVFSAGDLGVAGIAPVLFRRSNPSFARVPSANDNYAGVLMPPVAISFAKLNTGLYNIGGPGTEETAVPLLPWRWGWFDGSTNAPVTFPVPPATTVSLEVTRAPNQLSVRVSASESRLQLQTSTNLLVWTPSVELPPSTTPREIELVPTNASPTFFRAVRLP